LTGLTHLRPQLREPVATMNELELGHRGRLLLGFRDDGSAHGGLASRNDFAGADNVRCSPDEPPVAAEPRRALVGTYHKRRRRCKSTRTVGFEARRLALQGGTEDCTRGSSTTLARGFGSYSDPRFARAGAVFFDSSATKLFSMPPIKPVYTTPSSASSSYVDLRRAAGSGALDVRLADINSGCKRVGDFKKPRMGKRPKARNSSVSPTWLQRHVG
jgi:hypothetical protein